MKFGAFIRELRKHRGFKQCDFARMVGISDAYMCEIEHEHVPPPNEEIVQRIAQCLHVNKDELLKLANESRPLRQTQGVSEETRRKMSLAREGYKPTEATRLKLRMAHLGRKDSKETAAKKRANLERARQKRLAMLRLKRTYTDCDFCGKLGPEEEKSTLRYGDEDLTVGLCPSCFAEWQRKPDEAKVIKVGGQEKTA